MMNLKDLSWIEPIDPEMTVKFIASGKKKCFLELSKPSLAKDLKCPDCGSVRAFYNPYADSWSCLEDDCLNRWMLKSKEVFTPTSKMHEFCVPRHLESAKMDSCDQNTSFKGKWIIWAKNPIGMYLFTGGAGRGKTYAACCCLDVFRMQKKRNARFINVSDMYLEWKEKVKEGMEGSIIRKLQDLDLLVLDDIGQRTPTEGFLEFIYILINKRIEFTGGTIVTTNLNYTEMLDKFGQALTSRLSSGEIFKFEGSDRRVSW